VNDFGPKVREILNEHGCWLVRQGRGDHEIWKSPHSQKPFTVDGKIKSRHTANGILKQAGLQKQF
jgi:predicted RNA binding protein YcfA (HicA-like mRNA interferase family)